LVVAYWSQDDFIAATNPYSFWKRLHLFEHGDMKLPDQCLENFLKHARLAVVLGESLAVPQLKKVRVILMCLSWGPGDSLCSLVIVKAANIVLRTHPKVKFLLVGRECDTNNAALMRWLIDGGMQDSFILLGERKDIPACLAAMNVFCLPSRNEGFPNALGEAMLMGLPCVSTLVGDADVLVDDTGILVPSQDAQALAEGLLKVIALPESQRKQMGQHSKDRVMSEFSIKKTLARFEALYQQMVTNKT
jgi:hypothetical protein